MNTSRINEIRLIFLLAVAVTVFVSLITFNPDDIKFLTSDPNSIKNNVVGFIGAYLAWGLYFLMGYAAYAVPIFIALWGIVYLFEKKHTKVHLRLFGSSFSVIAISSIFSIVGIQAVTFRFQRGGIIGLASSDFLLKYLGTVGTFITISVLFLLSFLISSDFLLFPFIGWIFTVIKSIPRKTKSFIVRITGHKKREKSTPLFGVSSKKEKVTRVPEGGRFAKATPPSEPALKPAVKPEVKVRTAPAKKKEREEKSGTVDLIAELKKKKEETDTKTYEYPNIDILHKPPSLEERKIVEDFEESKGVLEDTLSDFGIEAKVVKVSRGPVITRYELEPAAGVKIHRITSLSDNIALAMKAVTIRVVAPIPGKGTVGVEVPNSKSALVFIRELIGSKEYQKESSKLKLAIGKDISGAPIVADLADMPHLLIAGATGSGKTVCVNSIITSLLFNASPEEVKFLMVDPKRVELAAFNKLPHLLGPVVTEPKKVSAALSWVVNEMEKRYEIFAQLGVRNIDGYNKNAKSEHELPMLPYIVVIVDELADLMLVAQQEIENMITRLAQLSRAVGIHIIIATQRPSVDVITGVIKANFPARISFKVASKVDSRTVLDMNGAEKLLGRGDMLFVEPGNPKAVRAQGVLVTDDEIGKIASFIKSQRTQELEEEIIKVTEKQSFKKFDKDEVYDEAVKLVLQTKQASVSMLQRRLGVGYTRAARLIDMMEDEGIVGSYQGSKPREILVDSVEAEG